jgi:hypothetical protein
MLAVVSCRKYHQMTMRIADVGDRDLDQTKALLAGLEAFECPMCGPCSHVEISWRNYFDVHSLHESLEEAQEAARQLDAANPDKYRLEGIPKATEAVAVV